jgi:hypothetical protein
MEREGQFAWEGRSGYYAQAYAEHAFSRCKRLCGDGWRAKRDAFQERDASLAGHWLNQMRELDRLRSYPVS